MNLNPLVSMVITGPLVFVIGWLLHETMFRRLMDTSPSLDVFEGKSMLASFGLLYIVQNIGRIIWGSSTEASYLLEHHHHRRRRIPSTAWWPGVRHRR